MRKFFEGFVFCALVTLVLPFVLSSCMDSGNPEDPAAQLLQDIESIDSFLESTNTTAVEHVTGVRMVVTELGTGLPAMQSNSVDVDYVGKLFTTNATFDQGNVKGILSNYIAGWQIAMATLPAGTKATLYIPPYWGYGNRNQGSIPPNSILVFDVNFKSVVQSSQERQRLAADTVAIDTYLESKTIEAIKDTTGMRYVVNETGTGAIPTWFDKVKVKISYRLLTDDTKVVAVIDREPTEDFNSWVVDYVHGIQVALQKLPAGSKATLYIPSGLGFGPLSRSEQGGAVVIPANANLIVDLEFISLVP